MGSPKLCCIGVILNKKKKKTERLAHQKLSTNLLHSRVQLGGLWGSADLPLDLTLHGRHEGGAAAVRAQVSGGGGRVHVRKDEAR